jgi:hypothetical protein
VNLSRTYSEKYDLGTVRIRFLFGLMLSMYYVKTDDPPYERWNIVFPKIEHINRGMII